MFLPRSVEFATTEGRLKLDLDAGRLFIIAGPNGTGKSAFLTELYRGLGEEVATFLPGHRQINFNNSWDANSMGVEQINRQLFRSPDNFNRHKNSWPEEQFKAEIKVLLNREAEYSRDQWKFTQMHGAEPRTQTTNYSPVDIVNKIFAKSSLPIQLALTRSGISAVRDGSEPYSIERLSDGERAALYLAASITNLRSRSVIIVDEPEKHLDRTISTLLIDSCIRSRDDICIVMATHDHRLLSYLEDASILHIRNSQVLSTQGETRSYDVSAIPRTDAELSSLQADLMGVRDRVLFVEGANTSEDLALYSSVYSSVKVVPKGGWESVCEATRGIIKIVDGHWLEPRGLIDGDGRTADEIDKLKRQGVYSLPFPTVENIFFIRAAIDCFIEADMAYYGGQAEEVRLANFESAVLAMAKEERGLITARRASWRIERALSEQKVSPRQIVDGELADIVINVSAIVSEVDEQVGRIIAADDAYTIMTHLPVENTKLPDIAAKALGAESFKNYKKIILRQIDVQEVNGIRALARMREVLPDVFANKYSLIN